ncbi:aspartyl-tRNA(Asn)/glutamyl-tRNA(Gln) amidotransferase subunit A [Actinomadura pelletieri DSM 43383]|uniref:Aspartyl-tRNA(Asn)/glutamyl-tRNA(Gln) amidotransferase subunit A n=1 Tax=Actinomadura pelletieri DSM 43383 TaxID=1120940 RepID=A0A495QJE5_9ACTN|nr:amidase [Actinomadura pelletieri]RKS72114.1 aspartyl-tRNA(Asn)/glutamyl-tRNA(Gln) amidotransferase subunit A [Actinomadura pelletieri DSM 43383]
MSAFFAGRTLRELGHALRSGDESATGLLSRALEAIDADQDADPTLNAFVTVDREGAEAAARRVDEELASGVDRGPLHGLPVAVKDIIDVAGLPTGMGSAHFTGHVAETDAACVTMMRAAGAVIVGKTGTHEFAYGGTGDVSVHGPVRNPHDRERMSGGSSAGSAAAVAAGMVPLALGTDTGGSVRIPAAFCGIAGFKPAFGVLPTRGVFPLAASFDHVGLLAGSADDCRIAYQALTGSVGAAPSPVDGGSGTGGEYSVGWIEPLAADPEVVRVVRAWFPDAPSERLDLDEIRRVFRAIQESEAYDVHAERVEKAPELYQPATLERLKQSARAPGWRYVRAVRERERVERDIAELLERYDLLALPTLPITAPKIGETEGPFGPHIPLLVSLTCPFNLIGLPALSVPVGTVRGLPVGAQLVTRRGAEDVLFEAATRLTGGRPG